MTGSEATEAGTPPTAPVAPPPPVGAAEGRAAAPVVEAAAGWAAAGATRRPGRMLRLHRYSWPRRRAAEAAAAMET
jgi:hypothetical protein